ncbi:DUF4352 domain-containing protein [Candidatus Parcubacteria bacterium]|nr:DUF4352 domain-containing protein [Candidatus Parcubacteria bacterium]
MKKTSNLILIVGIFMCMIGFTSIVYADSLASRMAGKILLQVEENGEAWYVNPVNQQKYFLGRPAEAFELMRKLGMGITNDNLNQIPTATDSATVPKKTEESKTETSSNESKNESSDNTVYKSIGDETTLSTYKFKVNFVSESNFISGTFGTKTAKAGTKFVNINLDVTNITNSEFSFFIDRGYLFPEGFVLLTDTNKQYNSYDDMIMYSENSISVRDLSPDIKENGNLVYEIPSDVTSYGLVAESATDNKYYVTRLTQ